MNRDCDAASADYRGYCAYGRQHGTHYSRGCAAGMLDHIRVEAYDEKMPLHTLATVLARDAQLLVASVYDPAVSRVLHGVGPCWGRVLLVPMVQQNDCLLGSCTHIWACMLCSAHAQTLPAVEKAIASSPLGLNPRISGQEILIPVPRCVSQPQWSHRHLLGFVAGMMLLLVLVQS